MAFKTLAEKVNSIFSFLGFENFSPFNTYKKEVENILDLDDVEVVGDDIDTTMTLPKKLQQTLQSFLTKDTEQSKHIEKFYGDSLEYFDSIFEQLQKITEYTGKFPNVIEDVKEELTGINAEITSTMDNEGEKLDELLTGMEAQSEIQQQQIISNNNENTQKIIKTLIDDLKSEIGLHDLKQTEKSKNNHNELKTKMSENQKTSVEQGKKIYDQITNHHSRFLEKTAKILNYFSNFSESIKNLKTYVKHSSKISENLKMQVLGMDTNLNLNINNKTARLTEAITNLTKNIKTYFTESANEIKEGFQKSIDSEFNKTNASIKTELKTFTQEYIKILKPILEENKKQYTDILEANNDTKEKIEEFYATYLKDATSLSEQLDFINNSLTNIPERLESLEQEVSGMGVNLELKVDEKSQKLIKKIFSLKQELLETECNIKSTIKKGNQSSYDEIAKKIEENTIELNDHLLIIGENAQIFEDNNNERFKSLANLLIKVAENVEYIKNPKKSEKKKKSIIGKIISTPFKYVALLTTVTLTSLLINIGLDPINVLTNSNLNKGVKPFSEEVIRQVSTYFGGSEKPTFERTYEIPKIKELISEINQYETEKTNLTKRIEELSHQLQNFEQNLNQETDETKKQEYNTQINELNTEINKINTEKTTIEKEKNNLEEQINTINKQYETETNTLNENIKKLTEEKTKLEKQIQQGTNQEEKLKYKKQIQELNTQIENTNKEKIELEENKQKLEEQIDSIKQDYEDDVLNLKTEKTTIEKEKNDLEKQINTINKQYETETNTLNENIKKLTEDKKDLESRLNTETNPEEINEYKARLNKLNEENLQLLEDNMNLDSAIKLEKGKLKTSKNMYDQKIAEQKQRIEELEQPQNDLKKAYEIASDEKYHYLTESGYESSKYAKLFKIIKEKLGEDINQPEKNRIASRLVYACALTEKINNIFEEEDWQYTDLIDEVSDKYKELNKNNPDKEIINADKTIEHYQNKLNSQDK